MIIVAFIFSISKLIAMVLNRKNYFDEFEFPPYLNLDNVAVKSAKAPNAVETEIYELKDELYFNIHSRERLHRISATLYRYEMAGRRIR